MNRSIGSRFFSPSFLILFMQSQNSPQAQVEWDGQKSWAFLCLPMRFRGIAPTLRVCFDNALLLAKTDSVNYFVGFAVEEPVVFGVLPMELNNQGFIVSEDSLSGWTRGDKIATVTNGVYEATVYKAFSRDGRSGIWVWDGKRARVYPILFVEG